MPLRLLRFRADRDVARSYALGSPIYIDIDRGSIVLRVVFPIIEPIGRG